MTAEIYLYTHGNKLHFRKCVIIHNITVQLFFFSNKCILYEYETSLKTLKLLTKHKLLNNSV